MGRWVLAIAAALLLHHTAQAFKENEFKVRIMHGCTIHS